ncbi:hypothetical protein [Sinorhizobium meliloti]|uniref:hypothetical protein n=1 Tax=Rhizobium meliloti TaxID=382 RepID=UPI0003FFB6AC|nr:hypothetical protein [Sinorhizobium meliloti]MDX1150234.1 hypothetical protein [Sinorhizobium medicae]UFX07250.1 hypothetical protein SmelRRI128_12310 [Sinorhizobium meliloti]
MRTDTPAQTEAKRRAFEAGQNDFRDGKKATQNPYPPESPYFYAWEQGWQDEHDIHFG